MAGKQAKILSDDNIDDLLGYAARSRYPARNGLARRRDRQVGLGHDCAADRRDRAADRAAQQRREAQQNLQARVTQAAIPEPIHPDDWIAAFWKPADPALSPEKATGASC